LTLEALAIDHAAQIGQRFQFRAYLDRELPYPAIDAFPPRQTD
jgi:hypothetical protein